MSDNVFLTNEDIITPSSELSLATVISSNSTNGTVYIQFDGMTGSSGKAYKALSSAFPLEVGSRVVVMKQSGTYVVLGKISGASVFPISMGGSGQSQVDSTSVISDIATAGANITLSFAYYSQWGKIAMIEINATATANISSGSVIFTLVSGKRPALESSAQVWLSTSLTSVIRQNGEVLLGGNLSSGNAATILASYLLQ